MTVNTHGGNELWSVEGGGCTWLYISPSPNVTSTLVFHVRTCLFLRVFVVVFVSPPPLTQSPAAHSNRQWVPQWAPHCDGPRLPEPLLIDDLVPSFVGRCTGPSELKRTMIY